MVDDDDRPSAVQDALDAGGVSWDLSEPPTRAEVGLEGEASTVIYEYGDERTLDVTVGLPADERLRVDAQYAAFSAPMSGSADPPESLDLKTSEASVADAGSQLTELARRFGLDVNQVEDWIDEAGAAEGAGPRVKSAWMRSRVGYLTLEVQARYDPEVDAASVHYLVHW